MKKVAKKHNRILILKNRNSFFIPGFSLANITFKENTGELVMPMPNLSALFLNISDKSLKRAILLNEKTLKNNFAYNFKNNIFQFPNRNIEYKFFDYLEEIITSIIFSYTAVESICNNLLPNNFKTQINKNKQKIYVDKKYLERKFNLTTKIKKFIVEHYKVKIDFQKIEFWNDFIVLEKYRNELIHLKSLRVKIEPSGAVVFKNFFISKLFISIIQKPIIQSARKVIELLVNTTKGFNGLPLEFIENHPDVANYFQHFEDK
jgi:hypothetical protein